MKISFESNTIEGITEQLLAFLASVANDKYKKLLSAAADEPKPTKKVKKEEVPEVIAAIDEEVSKELSLEGDVIPAFQAYVKRETANVGKDEAIAAARKILASFGAKSSRELEKKDWARAVQLVG